MKDGMDRREFLKFSMVTGALLVAGEGIKAGVMAQGTGRVTEVDKLTVWVLTDNYYDVNRAEAKIGKRYRAVPGKSMHAEHGLSYYVETVIDGKTSTCMFDYGLDYAVTPSPKLLVDAAGAAVAAGHYATGMVAMRQVFPQLEARRVPEIPNEAWRTAFRNAANAIFYRHRIPAVFCRTVRSGRDREAARRPGG